VTADKCVICGERREQFGRATILGRHDVAYYRCERCGFIQTETPYWLDEAYSDAIAASDIGLVGRNIRFAETTRAIISAFFDSAGRFLDYGGGYGMFVRLMRDGGFDFYREDPLCDNLFAQGFDRQDDGTFELVTAFEVFEHLPSPVEDATLMLGLSDSVLFSTLLMPAPPPAPGEWWYYALEAGQHVSFYTREALAALADRLGVHVASSRGNDLHLLTKKPHAARWFPLIATSKAARLLNAVWPRSRPSRLASDYEHVTGHKLV